MITGLADEKEVRPEVEDQSAQGLAAVQVVAEEDRPVGAQLVAVGGQPALGGVALAVLLALLLGQTRLVRGRVLLGLDELRHERQDAVVAVGDDRRREHRMEVLLGLVGPDMADRALRAADRVGAVDLDSVERDRNAAVEAEEGLEGPVVAGGSEAIGKQGGEAVGVVSVEEIPNGVVTRDVLDTEQGLAIGASGCFCMRRWKSRKEGAWRKNVAKAQEAASAML